MLITIHNKRQTNKPINKGIDAEAVKMDSNSLSDVFKGRRGIRLAHVN